jgi:hypothetical protein
MPPRLVLLLLVAAASAEARRQREPTPIVHPDGELPPHRLEHCVLHAGTDRKSTRVIRPPPAGGMAAAPRLVRSTRSCSFDSECNEHRGQPPGPTDGTVDISCREDRCTCRVTSYVPAEVHVYRFVQHDPCEDVKRLLREVCGG